jgi:sialate O-acetylesterase
MRITNRGYFSFLISFLFLVSLTSTADVKMPAIFADNMVLQQNQKVPVWGWADKGEKVTVSFSGQEKSAIAGDDGNQSSSKDSALARWMVTLDPMKAYSKPQTMTVSSSKTSPSPNPPISDPPNLQIKNALVGEVWLCSGQSNMAFALSQAKNAKQEISEANYPAIRQFTVFRKVYAQPESNLAGSDKIYQWADAKIKGDTVVLSSAKVDKPVAVRYAWGDNPTCNLYNKEGLPAVPFRTDRW